MDEMKAHIQTKIHEYERLRAELEKRFHELQQKYQADRMAIDAIITVLEDLLKHEVVQ